VLALAVLPFSSGTAVPPTVSTTGQASREPIMWSTRNQALAPDSRCSVNSRQSGRSDTRATGIDPREDPCTPGHIPVVEEPLEIVEFSPSADYEKTTAALTA
jgi:hypothetical protein